MEAKIDEKEADPASANSGSPPQGNQDLRVQDCRDDLRDFQPVDQQAVSNASALISTVFISTDSITGGGPKSHPITAIEDDEHSHHHHHQHLHNASDDSQDDHEQMMNIRENVENVISDESAYTESIFGGHTGDDSGQQIWQAKESKRKSQSALGALQENPTFPQNEKSRRVSEQEAALVQPSSNWDFTDAGGSSGSANVLGQSTSYHPYRANSGQNFSEGALCQPQTQNMAGSSAENSKHAMSQKTEYHVQGGGEQNSDIDLNRYKSVDTTHAHISLQKPADRYHQNQRGQFAMHSHPQFFYQQQSAQLANQVGIQAQNQDISSGGQGYILMAGSSQQLNAAHQDQHHILIGHQASSLATGGGSSLFHPQQVTAQTSYFQQAQLDQQSNLHHSDDTPHALIQTNAPQPYSLKSQHDQHAKQELPSHNQDFATLTGNLSNQQRHRHQNSQTTIQTANSSIFYGTLEQGTNMQHLLQTPPQSHHFAYDSQINSNSQYDPSDISTPQKNFVNSWVNMQSPTLNSAVAGTPDMELKHRSGKMPSTAKTGLITASSAEPLNPGSSYLYGYQQQVPHEQQQHGLIVASQHQLQSQHQHQHQSQQIHDLGHTAAAENSSIIHSGSQIDSSHEVLKTINLSAQKSPVRNFIDPRMHPGSQVAAQGSPGYTVGGLMPSPGIQVSGYAMQSAGASNSGHDVPGPGSYSGNMHIGNQIRQQHSHLPNLGQHQVQQQLFFGGQQSHGVIPQFQHSSGSAVSQSQSTHLVNAFQPVGSQSAVSGYDQSLQPMFAGLKITSSNFRGSASEAKSTHSQGQPNFATGQSHQHFQLQQQHSHVVKQPSFNQSQQVRGRPSKQATARSDHNSLKSDLSPMLAKNINTSATSQKSQSQSVANLQDSSNLTDDQQASILISRLNKLPQSASQSDKQDILRGHITKLATTQTGSRYLQNQLTKSNNALIELLLQEVGQKLSQIMVNQYGNYFFQKLLQNCSVQQRLFILDHIRHDFIEICCHKQGTHTIQTIFDNVTMDQEESFIKQALQGHVYRLSIDQWGTHVIRKVLSCRSFDQAKQSFIFDEILANLNQLCLNKNGLCVIKIIIQLTKSPERQIYVIELVLRDLIELVSDPFGNYAVSEIIENWEPAICKPIFEKLSNKIFELSIQKYSSNVIETCLKHADPSTQSMFIREISCSDRLYALVSHNYGNFVIQKALKLATGREKQDLVAAIERACPQIQDKKIRDKWHQIIRSSAQADDLLSNNQAQENQEYYTTTTPQYRQVDDGYEVRDFDERDWQQYSQQQYEQQYQGQHSAQSETYHGHEMSQQISHQANYRANNPSQIQSAPHYATKSQPEYRPKNQRNLGFKQGQGQVQQQAPQQSHGNQKRRVNNNNKRGSGRVAQNASSSGQGYDNLAAEQYVSNQGYSQQAQNQTYQPQRGQPSGRGKKPLYAQSSQHKQYLIVQPNSQATQNQSSASQAAASSEGGSRQKLQMHSK